MSKDLNKSIQVDLADEAATLAFGARFADVWRRGGIITLSGDLGTGKTTFCRGYLRRLGWRGSVKSPTFTLVEPYEIEGLAIYHFDLYRLTDPEELEYVGAMDYFQPQNLCFIEWPERGEGELPDPDFHIEIRFVDDARQALVCPRNAAAIDALEEFR